MDETGDLGAYLRDPGALAALRALYRGVLDPADVIRWRMDPAALGADGARSPVVRAAELRPLLYGRADTAEGARQRDAAVAEAESLLAGWERDSAALDAAVAAHARPAASEPRPQQRRTVPWGRVAVIAGAAGVAGAVILALVLLPRPGATVVEQAAPTTTPPPSPTATPTPTPTRTIVPAPTVTQTPQPPLDLRPDYYEDDIMSVLQVPLNGDPIDNANGRAVVDDFGVPLYYVVANGDVFELIAKRFDLGTTYLASINAVRRDTPTELFVGDTINLGASTILRYGDQNGVTYDHRDRLPEPHVQQE